MPEQVLPTEIARRIVDPSYFIEPKRIEQTFAWVRQNAPLAKAELNGFDPFWVVSKYEDVAMISKRADLFDSTSRPKILMDQAELRRTRELVGGDYPYRAMAVMDDPEHRSHRDFFAEWFHQIGLARQENRVRRIACELIAEMREGGSSGDFVKDVASRYPLRVVAEMIGVDPDNEWRLHVLANQLFNDQDPELSGVPREGERLAEERTAKFQAMMDFFEEMTASRVRMPRDDLASIIAAARLDGEPLTALAAYGHYASFATAGHHTSAASLSSIIHNLCLNPGHLALLKKDPANTTGFIEESLRRLSPAKHFMRGATQDVELRGTTIRAGDWLYLSYASANHDEDIFESPFEFDMNRKPNRHLAFGIGNHHCLGNVLARLEMKVFLEEFLAVVSSVELAAEPQMVESRWVQGLKTLPIHYRFNATVAA